MPEIQRHGHNIHQFRGKKKRLQIRDRERVDGKVSRSHQPNEIDENKNRKRDKLIGFSQASEREREEEGRDFASRSAASNLRWLAPASMATGLFGLL